MSGNLVNEITTEVIAQLQSYKILKAFIKTEYEKNSFFDWERVIRFIDILESTEGKKR